MEDLHGWEVLPEDGFLEIHDDGGKQIFSRKYSTPKNVFTDYFSPKFVEITEKARVPNQLVPVPFQLEPAVGTLQDDQILLNEVVKAPIQIDPRPSTMPQILRSPNIVTEEADQDLVSQVFFKKTKETIMDMKLDSPKSHNNNYNSKGIKLQMDSGAFQFEEKADAFKASEALETTKVSSPKHKIDHEDKMIKQNNNMDSADIKKEENSGGLNILKWGLTGIGALCTFGVATVCIFVFGGLGKNKQHQQNQKLQFHIYGTEDKSLKQVVHHATKLNEAISAASEVPITRAHFTVGGYYDFI